MAFTVVPVVLLNIVSTGGVVAIGLYYLWYETADIGVLALLGAIVSFVAGERRVASGLLAGVAIGIISLGATCFANMATIDI